MKIKTLTYNTLPNLKDDFWQIVLIPTISILKSIDRHDDYVSVNLEWLFWSFVITFHNDKK